MKDLTPEQWKCIYNVMQKEVRHQTDIVESNKKLYENSGRLERIKNAKEIAAIALNNAGGPHAKVYEPK